MDREFVEVLIFPSKCSYGYMKNGGKKNETDSKLDCYHNRRVKPVLRGHGGRVVTLSPPTSEAGVRSPAWPQVGKLVVACRWSAVYSTEP